MTPAYRPRNNNFIFADDGNASVEPHWSHYPGTVYTCYFYQLYYTFTAFCNQLTTKHANDTVS